MTAADGTFEDHYFVTPSECETREECWRLLVAYMEEHATNRLVMFRAIPNVFSEKDFDTKTMRHRGMVRFAASPREGIREWTLGNVSTK